MVTSAKALGIGLVVACLALGVGACSGDDTNGGTPSVDGGGSSGSSSGSTGSSSGSSSGSTSSGSSSGSSGGGSSGSSSGADGGLPDFSVFVTNLVKNDTTASALPAAIPAPGTYSDNQSLADYPASFF